MATHKILIPKNVDKICDIMHRIIYKNPMNESEDIASLPVMLFGEVIETCHNIEEMETQVNHLEEAKLMVYKERKEKKRQLRSKLKRILGTDKSIPRNLKKLENFAKKELDNFEDKKTSDYKELKRAYEEYVSAYNKTEKTKKEYRKSSKELNHFCRKNAVILLRRVRDALKVNFYHLGKDKYLDQIKSHGFDVKKR